MDDTDVEDEETEGQAILDQIVEEVGLLKTGGAMEKTPSVPKTGFRASPVSSVQQRPPASKPLTVPTNQARTPPSPPSPGPEDDEDPIDKELRERLDRL